MKAQVALPLLAAALALAGCARSDKASDAASADNVEIPAEEALSGVTATPSADPGALASEAADEAAAATTEAATAAGHAASAAGAAVKQGADAAKNAADQAATAAAKKM